MEGNKLPNDRLSWVIALFGVGFMLALGLVVVTFAVTN